MRCPSCQHENPPENRFCGGCGSPLTRSCPSCNAENAPDHAFCGTCGARLEAGAILAERAVPVPTPPIPEAERRQLTVLFCDLVDSTELSSRLGAENYREVIRAYQSAAAGAITRYQGHVAQYLGDGVLAYFGYPRAHEDDAERAVRAGLGIVARVAALNERLMQRHGVRIEVRNGIHTGPVVIGPPSDTGGEALALGETTNVAARLQALAEPAAVVLSAATLRLVPGVFVTADLGERIVKGLSEPVHVFRAVQPSGVRSRLEVAAASGLTPFVARDQELMLLEDRWTQSREGRGQAVLISGEAGIGKSRLMQAFRERFTEQAHTWLECRTSPYTQDSPFYPILDLLRLALRIRPEDPGEVKLAQLEAGLEVAGFDLDQAVPLIASLLAVPLHERYAASELSPEGQRKKILALLAEWLLRLARQQPVVLLMEDLHWADPSSIELMGLFLEQLPRERVLLLLTFRPDFTAPWPSRADVTPLLLSRLTRSQLGQLVRKAARHRALPEAWVDEIIARSDGVPLFAEEVTKAVLEANPDADGAGNVPPLRIPDTLQDSLMARLDALGPLRELAQVASVLGREFEYPLLAELLPMRDAELRTALAAAVREELFYQRGTPPEASYLFRHALIRDAAYESLLRSTRQRHHQRAAETIIDRMSALAEERPELVAYHLAEAGSTEQAIDWWQRAGERAYACVANEEAIRHLQRGLDLLARLPDGPARDERELNLQMRLGRALIVARGYAVPETFEAWERARDLCDPDSDPEAAGKVYYGLLSGHVSRGEMRAALEPGAVVLRAGERSGDDLLTIGGSYGCGAARFFLGEFRESAEDLEAAISRFEPERHRFVESGHQEEFGIQAFSFLSWDRTFLGFPERSVATAERAIELATALGHPYTLAWALAFAGWGAAFRGDRAASRDLSDRGARLAAEQGFPLLEGIGRMVNAWADGMQGGAEGALERFAAGMALSGAAGNQGGVPLILSLLAELQLASARSDEAIATADGGLAFAEQTDQQVASSWLHRLRGEAILWRGESQDAESEFLRAIEVAREQNAYTLELRAATSLARLWQRQGKGNEARDLLQPIYDWFTEGFDTQDLIDAKALLEDLP
jgi:class 3 adenylate cyclase/predicted ATPase